MKINEKLLKFFSDKNISKTEIAQSYGGTTQNLWNILNKESGKVPLDFLIWVVENHPELNINALLTKDNEGYLVQEPPAVYEKRPATKDEILKEISIVLDKYL